MVKQTDHAYKVSNSISLLTLHLQSQFFLHVLTSSWVMGFKEKGILV